MMVKCKFKLYKIFVYLISNVSFAVLILNFKYRITDHVKYLLCAIITYTDDLILIYDENLRLNSHVRYFN